MKAKIELSRIYTWIVILYPVMVMYAIRGIPVLLILLILLYPFMLFEHRKIKKVNGWRSMLLLLIFYVFQLSLTLIINYETSIFDKLKDIMHNMFYLATIFLFTGNYFDRSLAKVALKKIAIFSTIYIILQMALVYLFNYYLSGALPFFDTMARKYAIDMNNGLITFQVVRPRSVFSEPSGHGLFISCCMGVYVADIKKLTGKNIFYILFLCTGLLISRSTTGILLMFAILGILFYQEYLIKKFTKPKIKWLMIALIILLMLPFTKSFQVFIDHTFEKGKGGTNARIEAYKSTYNVDNLTPREFIIGHNMGNYEGDFAADIPKIYYYFGMAGYMVYGIFCICTFFQNKNKVSRILFFILILQSCFGNAFIGINQFFFYSLIFGTEKIQNSKKKKIRFSQFVIRNSDLLPGENRCIK